MMAAAEYTLGPRGSRPCVVCGRPVIHGTPFATCSDACGRSAREADLDLALEVQRKRLDEAYGVAVRVRAPPELLDAIGECMTGNARLQDMATRRARR